MSYHYKKVLQIPKTPAEIREEMRLEGHIMLNQKVQARDSDGDIVLIGLVQYVGPGYARVVIKKQFWDPPTKLICFKVWLCTSNGHINMKKCYRDDHNRSLWFERASAASTFAPTPLADTPWPPDENPYDVPHPGYDTKVQEDK